MTVETIYAECGLTVERCYHEGTLETVVIGNWHVRAWDWCRVCGVRNPPLSMVRWRLEEEDATWESPWMTEEAFTGSEPK